MDIKKKGFHLPEKIRFDEETLTDTYGKLIAEPLEKGFGTTLGNAMRRVLLSSIEGAAVTAVRIKGAPQEFMSLPGVKEDVVDIILNIKKLRFRMPGNGMKTAVINAKGPGEVKGSDIHVEGDMEVLNPEQRIATVSKGATFESELYLRKGMGYVPAELNKEEGMPIGVIAVDSIYSPVKKVNFWVEKARVGRAADFDRLIMEIWTDKSINPERALSQAADILISHLDYFIFEVEEEAASEEAMAADEEPIFNENLLKGIDELELSVRAQNCLKNANIKSIADLVQKTEQDMLRTKNFGRKSLNEIKEILVEMGLRFGMRVDLNALRMRRGMDAP